MYYLSKQELWDDDAFIENVEFETELSILFEDSGNNSTICVGQATQLYEYLGGDQSLLKEYLSKIEDKKEHKEHNDNNKDGGEGQIQKEEENIINEVKKEDKEEEEQVEEGVEEEEEEKDEEEDEEEPVGY